ncbi:TetR/AcrR family transcriptional regulator [Companilactobacillus nantensis]|uniref:Transcription regulator n=1 Tax=Companilactobacillus nantensis DSM 16982 TaxID=1423774 RepID=A0A0R1WEV8_9LACO|nr:TetR/AcrR family transcriptional regulator [Companilactobacillus nantensis]KRM16053.1 transcription regulator [Companilactobacillus nantensis DSM 16982]GEO63840.1 TetR family transcriptional regulator [Companilactobacillus nantensis]
MKKVDLRVQKTNLALQQAFRQLASTTSYRNITVKELTETAHINRKTFYLHYDSIEDFSDTVVDEIADKLLQLMMEKPLRQGLAEPGFIFDKVLDFFQESREFYTIMMTSDDYSFLARKVETKLAKGLSEAIYKDFDISKLDSFVCANFLIRNTMMLFRIYNGDRMNLERNEFRDRLIRLDSSGLSSFIDVERNIRK